MVLLEEIAPFTRDLQPLRFCGPAILGGAGLSDEHFTVYPKFKNGTAYRALRPAKLDKIKNLHLEVQLGAVSGKPDLEREVYSALA